MAGIQLYEGLIKATEQIVAKFGKDVLTEERFVNILHDMCPDRDNPAMYRIIKTMINEGIASGLESTNKENVSSIVAKIGLSLSQKYGYDKILVEGIIYSLAIGYGGITYSDYNVLFAPSKQNMPRQQSQQQNSPNKKQNKPASCKQPQNNKRQTTRYGLTTEYFFLLLFGYIVLFFSPAIYLGLTCKAGWWPFCAIIPIAFLHFISILMVGSGISYVYRIRPIPFVGGLYVGLAICASLFWIFCPIVFGFNYIDLYNILYYYGFRVKGESPTIMTISFCFICAFCCYIFVPSAIEFSGIKIPSNSKFFNNCKIILGDKSFRNGFMFTCIFFIMVGIIGSVIPFFGVMRLNYKIERYNEKVEIINAKNNQIKKKRTNSYQALAFGIFKLGSSIDSCVSVAESEPEYKILKETEIPYSIKDCKIDIDGDDYSSIIDTTLFVSTIWDNNSTDVCLSFHEKSLVGITFVTDLDGDSLLSIYSKKYGKPEYELKKENKTDYYCDNIDEYLEDLLTPRVYFWTYANGIIKMYVSRDFRESGLSRISRDHDGNIVTYFDRRCEKVLKKFNAEKKRKEYVLEKRIQDSLRELEFEKQKQHNEERLRQEKNHRESMEKI